MSSAYAIFKVIIWLSYRSTLMRSHLIEKRNILKSLNEQINIYTLNYKLYFEPATLLTFYRLRKRLLTMIVADA